MLTTEAFVSVITVWVIFYVLSCVLSIYLKSLPSFTIMSRPALERICAKVYLAQVLPGCSGVLILEFFSSKISRFIE
jgi:hypothetical protein